MAPTTKIQVTDQTKRQPPTSAPHESPAKTSAPAQAVAVTGKGPVAKTAATFNQNPTLKPNPPDNGATQIISDQRQPAPRGPKPPLGGTSYGNQQQPIDK